MRESSWKAQQFGGVADQLCRAAVEALTHAHDLARGAHAVAEMTASDTYGNTMFVKSNELLLEYGLRIPGIAARKPRGQRSRFDLLVVEETSTAIYVWRYSDDPSKPRANAQFKTPISGLQSAMATLSNGRDGQMTIDDVQLTDEELAERDLLDAALSSRGSVVFLAYGSSFRAGLFDKGFAQITMLSDNGQIRWDRFEPLPDLAELDSDETPGKPRLRLVDPGARMKGRFDEIEDDSGDDLGIRARRPDEAERADAETDATGEARDEAFGTEGNE
jgi:hypothetical protein